MSPRDLRTKSGDRHEAAARLRVARKYLEVARLVDDEPGAGANVCVGLAVLAGIAAADAICLDAIGERYAGNDHASAAVVLGRVDAALASALKRVVDVKNESHYGAGLVSEGKRSMALKQAGVLVHAAEDRLQR